MKLHNWILLIWLIPGFSFGEHLARDDLDRWLSSIDVEETQGEFGGKAFPAALTVYQPKCLANTSFAFRISNNGAVKTNGPLVLVDRTNVRASRRGMLDARFHGEYNSKKHSEQLSRMFRLLSSLEKEDKKYTIPIEDHCRMLIVIERVDGRTNISALGDASLPGPLRVAIEIAREILMEAKLKLVEIN